jgi:hypothetical protein
LAGGEFVVVSASTVAACALLSFDELRVAASIGGELVVSASAVAASAVA